MIHKQYKLLFCLFAAFSLRAEQAEQSEFNLIKEEQDISRKPSPYVTAGQIAGGSNASSTDLANVSEGGTGTSSLTANALLAGGVTATSPLQSITSPSSAYQILVANGAAALPTWKTPSVNVRKIINLGIGTYVPTAGMKFCKVECVAGGGGAGGGAGTTLFASAGGGSGSYSAGWFTAAQIGASIPVYVGAGGLGGIGNNIGSLGLPTTFGNSPTLLSTNPGDGSAAGSASATLGGAGGTAGTGNIMTGTTGGNTYTIATAGSPSGAGAASFFGPGGAPVLMASTGPTNGVNAVNYGAGGSGGTAGVTPSTAFNGGNGGNGVIIITEFIYS